MPVAPTPAPHTPALFVLAGGMGYFNEACVKALNKCGYKPDDFGSHEEVQAKIREAKAARAKYEEDQRDAHKKIDPNGPDPHTAMLARCNSGHLSQDSMFRQPPEKPGQSNREKPCKNNLPPDGDARCYESTQAPCMPLQTHSGADGGGTIGSPHWAVGLNENSQRTPPGTVVGEADMSDQSKKNVRLALGEDQQSKKDYDNRIKNLPAKGEASQKERQDEAKARRQVAAAGQQASAKQLESKGGTGDHSGEKSDDKTKASDCIETFRQTMMAEMRRKAVEKYGRDYQKTKDAAESKLADASSRYDDAEKKLAKPNLKPKDKEALEEQKRQAQSDRGRAYGELRDIDCLNSQARSLCGRQPTPNQGIKPPIPPVPPFTGFNPR